MRQIKTVDLNGRKYTIGHWSVDKSLKTLVWLTKTFGEGFVALFTSSGGSALLGLPGEEEKEEAPKKSELSDEEEAAIIKEFVGNIVDRLDEDTYVEYSKLVVSGAKCDGKNIDFNTHFIGKMGELHRLMFEILRLQYGDFLGESVDEDLSVA
jgi:hypothetical protein